MNWVSLKFCIVCYLQKGDIHALTAINLHQGLLFNTGVIDLIFWHFWLLPMLQNSSKASSKAPCLSFVLVIWKCLQGKQCGEFFAVRDKRKIPFSFLFPPQILTVNTGLPLHDPGCCQLHTCTEHGNPLLCSPHLPLPSRCCRSSEQAVNLSVGPSTKWHWVPI